MNQTNRNRDSLQPSTPSGAQPGFQGYWWAAAAFAVLGLIMFRFDAVLAEPDNLQSMPGDIKRFVSLSEIFAHGFGIGIMGFGIWLLVPEKRRYIPRIVACAGWPPLAVHVIKLTFGRSRPICFFTEDNQAEFPPSIFDTFLGWLPNGGLNTYYDLQSFPSGHTATTWGLAIGMTWVFPKGRWLFFTLAVMASFQRVSSFAHWPSDVCFGAAIGFVMGGALTHDWGFGKLFGKLENRTKKPADPELV